MTRNQLIFLISYLLFNLIFRFIMTTINVEVNKSNFLLKESRTVLYFADIDPTVTDIDIKNFLGDFKNQAAHIELKYPKHSPFIAAVIVFKDHESAKKVKDELNMRKLRNRSCRIMWDDKDGIKNISYHTENNNIFVKNIPLEVTPREVYEVFSELGEIASVKITENIDGSHNGYGYISYDESKFAIEAINKCHLKPIFKKYPEFFVEVEFFKKQNQRGNLYNSNIRANTSKILEANATIFVKNLPEKTQEIDIHPLFETYGTISYFKPNYHNDTQYIKTFILSYDNEGSASKVENELNNKDFKGSKLIVEKLSYITDTKNIKSNNSTNSNIISFNKNCALFLKNIPSSANEETLKEVFSEFGTIKNVIINKQSYIFKDNGNMKEKESSSGIGQVHYDTQEEAFLAKEKMNGKFLPGYETWKLPLFVDIYISPKERFQNKGNPENLNNYLNPMLNQNNYMNNMMMNPMMMQMNNQYWNQGGNVGITGGPIIGVNQGNYYNNNYQGKKGGYNNNYHNNNYNNNYKSNNYHQKNNYYDKNKNQTNNYTSGVEEITTNLKNTNIIEKESLFMKVNSEVLKSLPDINQKKEYLGELIFNNINNHHLTQKETISIDEIGKITGMILGIEDLNEIIQPCTNYTELTSRIVEALKLIRESS